uniref:Uncharacterized protein n=1 Tax=Arundo donax TaxID=35708 RepID=A0A0A9D8M0_ARUDO
MSKILLSKGFLIWTAKLSFIFSFAWFISAATSGIAGFSSPSTTLRTIRSGPEALRQSSTVFQNSVESTMLCTSSPALVFANLFPYHASLTNKHFKASLCLCKLFKVRNEVANLVAAGLTRSAPVFSLIALRILPCL